MVPWNNILHPEKSTMKHLPALILACCGLSLALLLVGCDALAVTDVGYVRSQASKYSRLIREQDYRGTMPLHDPRMIWQTHNGPKIEGRAAIDGFLGSLRSITNMDTFYFYLHGHQKLDDKRILLDLTMQAHCVVSSMTMHYDNTVWRAQMLWIKTDRATWKIGGIWETSPRVKGDPPRDLKPL